MTNDELIADLLKELETIKGRVKELIAALKASEARVKELEEAANKRGHINGLTEAADISKEIADQFVGYMSRIERAIRHRIKEMKDGDA